MSSLCCATDASHHTPPPPPPHTTEGVASNPWKNKKKLENTVFHPEFVAYITWKPEKWKIFSIFFQGPGGKRVFSSQKTGKWCFPGDVPWKAVGEEKEENNKSHVQISVVIFC